MKKYTHPTAKVVELSVKESLSLTAKSNKRSFGFGSYSTSNVDVFTYAAKGASAVKLKTIEG